ncbi:MAG: type II toxin-antitoxin system VapC family toxin, partial [Candidatus Acidiferrum sp.]
MSRLLLDTHIGLWAFLEPHKLSTAVHQSLGDSKNARFLSAVSVWEAILLLEKRRLKVPQDFGQWFDKSKRELSLTAGMSWKVARELRFTLIGCSDPADRFLVATARAHDMTLV